MMHTNTAAAAGDWKLGRLRRAQTKSFAYSASEYTASIGSLRFPILHSMPQQNGIAF
jgi:hypothetical protein